MERLACIYHKSLGMRVVDNDTRERLVASGEWFRHPNDLKIKEQNDEKPIRQRTRKRS